MSYTEKRQCHITVVKWNKLTARKKKKEKGELERDGVEIEKKQEIDKA